MPVYAPSVAAATVLATAEHGTDGYAESCDDLDVIHALEEKELWRQVRYVWTERLHAVPDTRDFPSLDSMGGDRLVQGQARAPPRKGCGRRFATRPATRSGSPC